MLQDLLAELEQEVALSKASLKELKISVNQASEKVKKLPYFKRQEEALAKSSVNSAKSNQFSKASRFKEKKPDNAAPLGTGIIAQTAVLPSAMPHQKKQQNIIFSQSTRFSPDRKDDFRGAMYEVNYEPVTRKSAAIIINPPKQSAKQHRESKFGETSSVSSAFSDLDTQASMSFIGPGAYDIKFSGVEPNKGLALSKSRRFEVPKRSLTADLNPNYDAIKRRAPGAVIKENVPRSAQLVAKDEEQHFLNLQAAINQTLAPVDAFKAIKPKSAGVIISKSVMEVSAAPKGSREKTAAVFKFLDQLRELRGRGPGAYEIQPEKPAPTMVVYRKSSYSPIRKDPKEDIPGPDYYYYKDDLIRQNKPVWTFAKEEKDKLESLENQDKRDYNVDFKQVRPNPTAAIILKEHPQALIGEEGELQLQRGPGTYDPQFGQTEKRTDIGVIKMPQLNEKNTRENNMDYLTPFENFDNDLIFPSADPIKPNNKRGFTYHEPTDQKPDHVPDKELFPEKWNFYDYDLNDIRENMKKGGDFSSKMPIDIFAEHEEFMRIMKEYYDKENKMPHLGEYKIGYKQQDKHVPGVDIDKMQDKDNGPIVKPEGDVDGDNLIIDNPERLKKRLPDIKFSKMLGRIEEDNDNEDYEEELKLEVNTNVIKPKIPVLVDMKRQTERDDIFGGKGDKEEEEKIDVQINYAQQEKKIKGYVEIKKITTREEDPNYNPKPRETEIQLDIQTTQVKPQKKTSVNMAKGAVRFPPRPSTAK